MIAIHPLTGIGEVIPGDDLVALLGDALDRAGLSPLDRQDVLVVTQKIVSKAEGRIVALADVAPSGEASERATITGQDARLVDLALAESSDVLRTTPGVLICRHRLGLVMANAGIDQSNAGAGAEGVKALLLPLDPDRSAATIRDRLKGRFGSAPAVVISDSVGRAWRLGVTGIAIGAAGLPALVDARGDRDRDGRVLQSTLIALGDAVATAAALVIGEAAEGIPAALVRGLCWTAPDRPASALIRPIDQDLFP